MSRRHRRLLPSAPTQDDQPPAVPSLGAAEERPWISVMIPTYNCAALLRICLASVLSQDLGPDLMEIVVIDDRSEQDDPEAVVDELGRGRVMFLRHERNIGAIETFNDCVRHARGELVHILHGDDLVLPGFYEEIQDLACAQPESGLYVTGFTFIGEDGRTFNQSRQIEGLDVAHAFAWDNPTQFCATVMRRAALEAVGGFTPTLVHTADLEMWVRLSSRFGLSVSPRILASYRIFDGQHSAALRRTAGNLVDHERALVVLAHHGDLATTDLHLRQLRSSARRQAAEYRDRGDAEAERANLGYWLARASLGERMRRHLGILRRALTGTDTR